MGLESYPARKKHLTSSTLHVVATPIGNLEDITFRAVRVLGEVDLIAAEDTRVSRVLLQKYNIKTPMFSCHKFNEEKRGVFFLAKLLEGKNVALISDAGVPCISDPGYRLVSLAQKNGINVTSVCGASSLTAALSVSGFEASNFMFLGFMPKIDENVINKMNQGGVFVFFESPKRIKKTLVKLSEYVIEASICLCNDLSKMFEKIYYGSLCEVLGELDKNPFSEKGEYTCVIESKPKSFENEGGLSLEALIVDVMVKKNIGVKEAVREVKAVNKKIQKRQLYDAALRLKGCGGFLCNDFAKLAPEDE